MRVVFVHGACVRDGQWWWHRTAALLEEQGVHSVAVALPSCGETGVSPGADGPGLVEDAAALASVLNGGAGDEPTVVVAHSYGGIVVAQAAATVDPSRRGVRHLVLVSSYLPTVGQSLGDFGGEAPAPFLHLDLVGGTFGVVPDLLASTFLQDCDDDVRGAAPGRLARQSLHVVTTPVASAPWPDVPTTYVVCADDRGTPAAAQREFARRADRIAEVEAGHHPFLSQPEVVRDLLLGLDTATAS
ncbi:alpha/beta fold hydrolase [Terracoccus luteus]|uniref:Pimeloyl-ACP methyl ester carboxylesterase n=1 Tax=Terracoccus luteus TaxID=53356 RepID=A0A839Q2C1_9MICO|nr:alpha/beta hydrolase [Terracoccus luteus]MBB2987242.1 pimeloyl-ACP methyl ester carboxylesterase [Terracoccus luteus]MCP2172893.1 pimeloyl-ACP methyl ester carboxylesterase [Terracoccus luteus]